MVAYSFKRQFIEPIQAGTKCQTIRADRKRHARPGEPVQIYYALRTKQARKLLDPDPAGVFWVMFSTDGYSTGWYVSQDDDRKPSGPFATRAEAEQHAKDNAK